MTRDEIIRQLKPYFDIKELVCPHTYARHGEKSWMFLQTPLLHTLLVLRTDILNVPLLCNNWAKVGGKYSQRGLRCNLCDEVRTKTGNNTVYLSAHVQGSAVDLTSTKMTAEEMRSRIKSNATKLPYHVRIEKDKTWLHIDTYDAGTPVAEFKG